MKSTSCRKKVPCKFTFNVLVQIQERSSQFLGNYRLVHKGLQDDIVCSDCNQDLDRETVRARNWLSWSTDRFISDNIWTFCDSVFKTVMPLQCLEVHA